MHIAVTWDINASSRERWNEINGKMVDVLQPFSWVRPLTTFYVVRLLVESERDLIADGLLAVAESVSEQVLFLVSPTMPSAQYRGYLPRDMWNELNQRTG